MNVLILAGLVVMSSLVGCSAAQIQKNQAVLVQLKADARTVIVSGCQDLPAVEVLVGVVTPLIPQLAASGPAIAVGEGITNNLCAAIAKLPTSDVKVVGAPAAK